jgi:DNA polymerase-3 subunit alpha
VEVLVFPATYQKVSRYLQTGTVVLLKGRLNLREEIPKIVVNDLFPIEQVYKLITSININLSGLRENLFESLKELLATSRGRVPIYLHLDTPSRARVQVVVGDALYVEPNEKLIQDIEALLGDDRLSVVL